MTDQLALLPEYLTAHLQLCLTALGCGLLLSLPMTLWAARHPRVEGPLLAIAGVLQTIPGLALLALMVPILAWISSSLLATTGFRLRSIGFLPAVSALTLYSILPILRNGVTALSHLDPALIEAARGSGMTPRQRLWRVEIPVALPVIVAGIRTATVWVVGTATLATPVGATSLGNFIFSGLQTRNYDAILVGSFAAAGLALVLDSLVRTLEKGLALRSSPRLAIGLGGLAALATWALLAPLLTPTTKGATYRIGAKAFTEQYILAEILRGTLAEVGRPEVIASLGSTVAFEALRAGDIDLYVDYSGTLWATVLKRQDLPPREVLLKELDRELRTRHQITVLGELGFENTYAVAVRRADAERLQLRTISDLARHASDMVMGGDFEFFARPEWTSLSQTYRLEFRERLTMDAALMYQAVAAGELDVISAYSTDGRIEAFDLAVLEDDRAVIPPYDAVLVSREDWRLRHPEALVALERLFGGLSDERMRGLNWRVDGEGHLPGESASAFLRSLESP